MVSEGITGPFMIEGRRCLAGRCPQKTASGSAAHGGKHVRRNAAWLLRFVFVYLLILNPQEDGWLVLVHARDARCISVVHLHLTSWQLFYDYFFLGFLTKSPGTLHTLYLSLFSYCHLNSHVLTKGRLVH